MSCKEINILQFLGKFPPLTRYVRQQIHGLSGPCPLRYAGAVLLCVEGAAGDDR